MNTESETLAILGLTLLAVIGNVVNLPLFYGVHFIFGSIAVMLAVKLFGTWSAIWVALAGGAYTWLLWGHPYAMLTFTLEAAAVSFLYRRGVKNLVLADLMFWIVVGPLLVPLLYTGVLDMDRSAATMILLKQGLNGVFNALLAGIVIKALVLAIRNHSGAWLPAQIRLNELLFHVLLFLTLMAGAAPVIVNSYTDKPIREQLLARQLKAALTDVADSIRQQPQLLTNSQPLSVSASQKELVSGIALLNDNGVLVKQFGAFSASLSARHQQVEGIAGLSIWLPDVQGSLVNRWKAGRYQYRQPVSDLQGVTALVAEAPAAPLIQQVENNRNRSFMLLVGVTLLSILFSYGVSRILSRPLQLLDSASKRLPETIRYRKAVHLPDSKVQEYAILSDSLMTMGQILANTFNKLDDARTSLESEVEERTRELSATSAMLKNVLAGSTELAIIATDTEGTITLFNTGAEKLLGYRSDEVVDKCSPVLFHVPEEVETRSQELAEQLGEPVSGFDVFLTLPVREGAESREWHYVNKKGQQIPVSLTVTPIRDEQEAITGFLGIAQDITERKRMEQMKSEFVSTVSHELRTPLTSVSGALGLVLGGRLGDIPDKAEKILTTAHRNSERLALLINDLLDIEKIAAGKLHFDMQVQPLTSLLEQALEENKAYGAERHVKIALSGERSDVYVRVDEQRLKQVLANLLSNAIKFSDEGGTVNIDTTIEKDHVTVSVTDQGSGIPQDFQNKIFGKFAQADSTDTRQKGGTGLGLAITRELVEHMNGSIDFESTEGKGSRFYFSLPLVNSTRQLSSENLPDTNPVQGNSHKILIVEDDPDVANLLKIMLEDAGYQADICDCGEQALTALKAHHYDLISLDLMLPDISGLEIIRRLREHAETADIPIVVVSAKMEQGRLAFDGEADNIEWLAKPIQHDKLMTLVKDLLPDSGYPRILHVEDDMDLHNVINAMINEYLQLDHAPTLASARTLLSEHTYDGILLDIGLPDGSGWDLIPMIKDAQPDAAIIVLTGNDISNDKYDSVEGVLMKTRLTSEQLLKVIHNRIHVPH